MSINHLQQKKAAREIHTLLHKNETPFAIIEAQFKDVHNAASYRYGISLATDQRLLCYRKSMIGTVTSEEIPLSKVTGISYRKGIIFGSVIITSGGQRFVLESAINSEAERFANIVKELLSQRETESPISQPASHSDNLDQIEKLYDLMRKGILTQEEFADQKARLLK